MGSPQDVQNEGPPAQRVMNESTPDAAPYFPIPSARIISVEHPCIVKHVDKATQMLGSDKDLAQTVSHDSESTLGLRFDPSTPSIVSFNNKVDNILIKFTVPKRIGKRKRGSDQPFTPPAPTEQALTAKGLLRTIQDKNDHVQVTPLGNIENSHIFRSIPDFVYQPPKSTFTHDVETKLFSNDYTQIKSFNLPQTYGMEGPELIPPPVLSTASLPQPYSYTARRSNKSSTKLPKSEDAYLSTAVGDLDHRYQSSPPQTLPPLPTQPKQLQALVPILSQLFRTRPLWTRRALINTIPATNKTTHLRAALPYIAFWIRAGPWKDTLCRYGTDPRTSPAYAIYQTIHPRVAGVSAVNRPPSWGRSSDYPRSHLYSGVESGSEYDNRHFQLCDISDPDLIPLIATPAASSTNSRTFDPIVYGWFAISPGTLTKISILMSAKLEQNDRPGLTKEAINAFLTLPNHWIPPEQYSQQGTGIEAAQLPEGAPEVALHMADEYRTATRAAMKTIAARRDEMARVKAALLGGGGAVTDNGGGAGRDDDGAASEDVAPPQRNSEHDSDALMQGSE
jgi:general transcription factor 3C polypeptide 5 (transcription factor C subunit 1)